MLYNRLFWYLLVLDGLLLTVLGKVWWIMLDLTDKIIAFEDGELTEEETIELFQGLVDTGLAWQLQGFYGRTAKQLIDAGLVVKKVS